MKRILVVDDDPTAAEGLRMLLASDGYDTEAHADPAAALRALAASRFDAVVTDLEMPGVHGVDVVRAACAGGRDVVVVVVTAYTDSPASDEARSAGAVAVFAKPLDYDTLAEELARRLALPSAAS